MAENESSLQKLDPKNGGFCTQTKIYQSLRPPVPLPPLSQPLSITQYSLSLLHSTANDTALSTTTFLIDPHSGRRLTYATFLQQLSSLTFYLKSSLHLSKYDVAFILTPPSLHIPLLHFSLLSLGVTISPSNPVLSQSELTHLIQLSKPSIAFSTSALAHKLPPDLPVILLDSPSFIDMLDVPSSSTIDDVVVNQSDPAAILYSSGTTGLVKGVVLTHRNLIAVIAGYYYNRSVGHEKDDEVQPVSLFTVPLFHMSGFLMVIRAAAMGHSVVLMEKFDFVKMLEAVEKYKVTFMPVNPPLVVAMVKSDLVEKYDLSSLQRLGCGGAPLGKEVSERFTSKFPHVNITQGYGLTESGGTATRLMGHEEVKRYGSAGRLSENMEAKIVDPDTGEALPPGQRGELWLRGPGIMKGYAGDDAATASTLDSEGWLKTGDLCYFDSDGFLYVVERLKELIKYNAYQVPPAELEHLLLSMPEIADAAVIPYPDEEAGQIPMAFVVRKPGSTISATQIMDFIAKQVAPYKKIRRVAFVNSIPKSAAGKILRRELVNRAL